MDMIKHVLCKHKQDNMNENELQQMTEISVFIIPLCSGLQRAQCGYGWWGSAVRWVLKGPLSLRLKEANINMQQLIISVEVGTPEFFVTKTVLTCVKNDLMKVKNELSTVRTAKHNKVKWLY